MRAFHVQNEWPKGIGNPPDARAAEGFRLGRVGRPGADAAVQQEPQLLPLPLVLRLLRRAAHQLRRALPRVRSTRRSGVDAPSAVAAIGGKFADYDNREVPDTLEVVWHYPGDTLVTFSQFNATGARRRRPSRARSSSAARRARCTSGTTATRSCRRCITPNEFAARTPLDRDDREGLADRREAADRGEEGGRADHDADHARNFLDCVKSRKTPICDVEYGHRCTTAALSPTSPTARRRT